jgi:hypothetical protein
VHATAACPQKAKTVLHTAGIDAPYWGEVFMYAIHTPEPPSIYYQQGQVAYASLDWQS